MPNYTGAHRHGGIPRAGYLPADGLLHLMDGDRLSPTDGPRPAPATDPRRWTGARLHPDTPQEG